MPQVVTPELRDEAHALFRRLATQWGASPDLADKVTIKALEITKMQPGLKVEAHARPVGGGRYEIWVDDDVFKPPPQSLRQWSKADFLKSMAHEFRHVWQYESGMLTPGPDKDTWLWKGQPVSLSGVVYKARPWEQDAESWEQKAVSESTARDLIDAVASGTPLDEAVKQTVWHPDGTVEETIWDDELKEAGGSTIATTTYNYFDSPQRQGSGEEDDEEEELEALLRRMGIVPTPQNTGGVNEVRRRTHMRPQRQTATQKKHGGAGKRPDPKKSREAKQRFRKHKQKYRKALQKWHRSAKGKTFHRKLARFNARATLQTDVRAWAALLFDYRNLMDEVGRMRGSDPDLDELCQNLADAYDEAQDASVGEGPPTAEDMAAYDEYAGLLHDVEAASQLEPYDNPAN